VLLGFVPAALALVALGLAATGLGGALAYVGLVFQLSEPLGMPTASPVVMHNWRGVATRLVGDGDPGLIWPLTAAADAASLALLVAAWWRPAADERDAWLLRLAALIPAALLVSPHTNPHDASLLVLSGCWLAALAGRGAFPGALAWATLGAGHAVGLVGAVAGLRTFADLDVAFMFALLGLLALQARRAAADTAGPAPRPAPQGYAGSMSPNELRR
jgi:hypothetical protein